MKLKFSSFVFATILAGSLSVCASSEKSQYLRDSLSKEIIVMHPGPINRGVEITSDVADSKQSVILQQVENGVAVRMAVIYLLASKIERQ